MYFVIELVRNIENSSLRVLLGIITEGALRCVGQQTTLKSKYGGGYHLFVNCHKDKYFARHQIPGKE